MLNNVNIIKLKFILNIKKEKTIHIEDRTNYVFMKYQNTYKPICPNKMSGNYST